MGVAFLECLFFNEDKQVIGPDLVFTGPLPDHRQNDEPLYICVFRAISRPFPSFDGTGRFLLSIFQLIVDSAAAAALKTADERLTAAYATLGLGPEGFVPHYTCPTCKDTGMVNGRPCSCVAEAARTLRREEINAASPLALCSFDTFELDRYPAEPEPELGGTPRDYMGKVLAYCQRYANSFTPESRGLMFIGSAGLGKTHMALAIADTVLNRGFDVLYTSSAALAAQLGREHFDRAAEDPWLDACKEADLLILDDLGTEYISQLTISVLYELINTRMLCHRPTIYTSNIVDSSIFEARYTEKVASRILGSCQIFKFFGTDQRLKRGGKR